MVASIHEWLLKLEMEKLLLVLPWRLEVEEEVLVRP